MTTAVWFYFSASKSRESMEHSIRLAQANISGIDSWVCVGDKPPVNSVQWIRCPRISAPEYLKQTGIKRHPSIKLADSIWKCIKTIESKQIADDWIWLHDDHFVLKPMDAVDFFTWRSRGHVTPSKTKGKGGWREWRRLTFLELQNRDLPTNDFSDHQIYGFNKQKLQQTIDSFWLMHEPLLFETAYGNQHHGDPERLKSAWFRYVTCKSDWHEADPAYINLQNGRWGEHRERITNHQRELIK